MRKIQIYIENQLVNLFEDESISVKSTIQDVADIAKVFTDFSQTFNIPADQINNDILGHYYNNDLDIFDANTRVDARIEIDHTPFREGKMQLEGSVVANGQVEAYKISFYGDVVSLKDLFGEDKLRDLDYSDMNSEFSGDAVKATISDTSYLDVRYPLISSSRLWTYADGFGIDLSAHAIDYRELFPAISDAKIMSLIASKYGVTFEGNFLDDDRFKKSYTWWKNREISSFISAPVDLEFNATGVSCDPAAIPNSTMGVNTINLNYIDINTVTVAAPNFQQHVSQSHKVEVFIAPVSTGTYYLDVYDGGTLANTYTSSTGQSFTVADEANIYGLSRSLTFKIRANSSFTFNFEVKYTFEGDYFTTDINYPTDSFAHWCTHQVTSVSVPIFTDYSFTAPDQKISDWFSGTLKEFNLTCYPLAPEKTYQVEPLEMFYLGGDEVDITPYVDSEKILVDRVKLYNEVSFEWAKSNSFINEQFFELFNRRYGDLKQIFPNHDGGKYSIELPFETIMFNKFTGTDLQVAYCLTKAPDYKPYVPKPVKLYLHESAPCSFYFNNGTTDSIVSSYVAFGQDTVQNTTDYTMNFGEEISSIHEIGKTNSLYKTYYQPYLANLFSTKTRKVTVKCVLPIDILTKLTLDDAIIIRDKKYRINDMTTDLTTGLSRLVLLSDFTVKRRRFVVPVITSTGGSVVVPVKPPKKGWAIVSPAIGGAFGTPSVTLPATITEESSITISAGENTDNEKRSQVYEVIGYREDGSEAWRDSIIIYQDFASFRLLTESGSNLIQENLSKILL